MRTFTVLVASLVFGGCNPTVVIKPPEWPKGVEVLAAPPAGQPIAMIEMNEGFFDTLEGCREDLAEKAKSVGASAIYVQTENAGTGWLLIGGTGPTCRGFAYAAVSHDAPASPPSLVTTTPPTPTKSRK